MGYILVFTVGKPGRIAVDGRELDIVPRRLAAIVPTGRPGCAKIETVAPFDALSIHLDCLTLQRELHVLTGARAPGAVRFEPRVVLDGEAGARLLRLIDAMLAELGQAGRSAPASAVLRGLAGVFGSALLLGQPHNQTHLVTRATRSLAPRAVRLAQAYLEAHFFEAVRMEDVARAAGVHLRTLQNEFRRHAGLPLSAALRRKRLNQAHRLLEGGRATVAQVALDCGFPHLGRFSAEYRHAFGEAPSKTLRDAQIRRTDS